MYKKILLILCFVSILCISRCGISKDEAFVGVEDVVDKNQINIHFDWMDHQLSDDDSSQFYFTITDTKTHKQGFLSCGIVPKEGKLFFASTFSSKMQIDFLKVAWGISPVLHFLRRHSFRCRRGAVAGIQSLLVTDM